MRKKTKNKPRIPVSPGQLELDFSVLPFGSLVRVSGFDIKGWMDLTGSVGIVDYVDSRTGSYAIYFPEIQSSWGLTILFYNPYQLQRIPGKRKTSWQRKLNL